MVAVIGFSQRIPAPVTQRQMLESFLLFDEARDLSSVLGQFDYGGASSDDAYQAVLGQNAPRAEAQPASLRSLYRHLLLSPAFADTVRPSLAAAFPEKRRLIFIHIPKCAGTDMTAVLRRHHPVLAEADCRHHLAEPAQLFATLRNIMIGLHFSSSIGFAGHEKLAFYQASAMIRPEDWVFTVLRAPRAMVFSLVSYVLTRCLAAPDGSRADVRTWLAGIGLDHLPPDLDRSALVALGRQLLRSAALNYENPITSFLGDGTAEGAASEVASSRVELTCVLRYSAWRAAKLGPAPARQLNRSRPLFTEADASKDDLDLIDARTTEDRRFFDWFETGLRRTGQLSLAGTALAPHRARPLMSAQEVKS